MKFGTLSASPLAALARPLKRPMRAHYKKPPTKIILKGRSVGASTMGADMTNIWWDKKPNNDKLFDEFCKITNSFLFKNNQNIDIDHYKFLVDKNRKHCNDYIFNSIGNAIFNNKLNWDYKFDIIFKAFSYKLCSKLIGEIERYCIYDYFNNDIFKQYCLAHKKNNFKTCHVDLHLASHHQHMNKYQRIIDSLIPYFYNDYDDFFQRTLVVTYRNYNFYKFFVKFNKNREITNKFNETLISSIKNNEKVFHPDVLFDVLVNNSFDITTETIRILINKNNTKFFEANKYEKLKLLIDKYPFYTDDFIVQYFYSYIDWEIMDDKFIKFFSIFKDFDLVKKFIYIHENFRKFSNSKIKRIAGVFPEINKVVSLL